MGESFNYIEVLCRVGGATVTVSEDWAQSIGSVKKYADMLAALDYNIMYGEAQQPHAKKTLEGWSSREVRCWSLCWLIRNAKQMYKWQEKLLGNDFRKIAEAQKDKGTWTFDEWRDYRVMCDDTLYQWKERLNELLSAYGYEADKQRTDHAISYKRPEKVRCLFGSDSDCDEFFEVHEEYSPAWWAHRAAKFIEREKIEMEYGFKGILWEQIEKEFPDIGKGKKDPRQAFIRTLNNEGYKSK